MSFNIALSGVNASQKDLDVTANNIANVNTIGFKESRAEFADVYATSIFSNAKTAVGNGVKTADVAQQFHQGSLAFTQNALDLAISGEGFFVTASDITTQTREFTRAGAFKLNSDNFIVNSQGQYLQGYTVNTGGTPSAVSMAATKPIQINSEVGTPTQTTEVSMSFNLPSGGSTHDIGDFDPTDSDTYTSATSVTVYDSQGGSHVAETYFVKDDTAPNTWHKLVYIDGKPTDVVGGFPQTPNGGNTNPIIPNSARLVFDSAGALDPVNSLPLVIKTVPLGGTLPAVPGENFPGDVWDRTNGSVDPDQEITFNLNSPTQYASAFEVSSLSQDGSTVGKLTGIDIGPDGLVVASYSNGQTTNIAKVATAKFANNQGLGQIGDTSWQQTQLSGEAIAGEANSGTFGKINSASLEQANVNLTEQLVNLITAQRNFQANSRALEVNSTLQQTIIQIR
ncbi:flagellar hook protein FlgE [Alginatibacterium sediminis]|uniref:Flagellar hook protein FlgE n=1 Tax=Alginatibacterium sediminis TaxID=2164068 RepID=A0A420EFZ2_9ALTE|nr:flagellar hook protein FlgE [Alginatibacterium sediminis]RKF19625.1 flagellar hook protein FlgE [Alginatibacterium sediminis]